MSSGMCRRGAATAAGPALRRVLRPIVPAADETAARAILRLQREAYSVEAVLIGSDGIPALTESLEALRAGNETWLGCFGASGLEGAVSWRLLDDGTVDICRLIVAPRAFRTGVASALLDELDRHFPTRPMIVSTGSANVPALAMYRRRGFTLVRQREAAPGLLVSDLARDAPPAA